MLSRVLPAVLLANCGAFYRSTQIGLLHDHWPLVCATRKR
jgi:hypothetical protein